MSVIDDYIQKFNPAQKAELQRLRDITLAAVPNAEEAIWYNMPTIKQDGKAVIAFDGHKDHIGIYPCSGSVINKIAELGQYGTSKGAIREQLDNLLPDSLVRTIIKIRLTEIENGRKT